MRRKKITKGTLSSIVILFIIVCIIAILISIISSIFTFLSNYKYELIIIGIAILSLFIGGIVSSSFVWKMIDIFVGLLTIINTYSIFMLRDVVVDKVRSSN